MLLPKKRVRADLLMMTEEGLRANTRVLPM